MIILKFNELNTSSSPYLTYDDFIGKKVSDYIVDSIDSSKKGILSIVFRMVSSDKKKFDMNKTVSGEEIKSLSSRKYHSITFGYSIKDDVISYILGNGIKINNLKIDRRMASILSKIILRVNLNTKFKNANHFDIKVD